MKHLILLFFIILTGFDHVDKLKDSFGFIKIKTLNTQKKNSQYDQQRKFKQSNVDRQPCLWTRNKRNISKRL